MLWPPDWRRGLQSMSGIGPQPSNACVIWHNDTNLGRYLPLTKISDGGNGNETHRERSCPGIRPDVAGRRSNREVRLSENGTAFAISDTPRCGDRSCAKRCPAINLRECRDHP